MRHFENIYNLIDSLNISNSWKKTFKKIQVAYYHNFYQGKANNVHFWRYGQNVMGLSAENRFKFFTRFNFFALIFGSVYYLSKLIFPKAFILLLIEGAVIYYSHYIYNPLILLACILIHIYTAIYANNDYFTSQVLNNKYVKANPEILSDYIDDNFAKNVLKEQSLYAPFATFAVFGSIFILLFAFIQISQYLECKNLINQRTKICITKSGCYDILTRTAQNIKNNPTNIHKEYFNMGAAYYELGDKYRALEALNYSISKKRKYLPPYLLKGIILTELKQFNTAAEAYNTAIKISPQGEIFYLLGSTYYKEGKFTEAKDSFEKAVRAYPDRATYWEALAYAKIYLRDASGAKAALSNAIKALKKDGETKNAAKIERIEAYMRNIR